MFKELNFTYDKICIGVAWKGRELNLAPQQRELLVKLARGPLDPLDFGNKRGSTEVAITRLRQCLHNKKVPLKISNASTGKWRLEVPQKKTRPR